MSTTEFDLVMAKLDGAAIVKYFAEMKERDRKSYAARALEWYEIALIFEQESFLWQMRNFLSDAPKRTQEDFKTLEKVKNGEIAIPEQVRRKEAKPLALLAVTACAGLSDLRKLPMGDPLFSFEIMRERKPGWLNRWLDLACLRAPLFWEEVRKFETDDLAISERETGYWLAMALTLGQKDADELSTYITGNTEIKETMLWQMLDNDAAVQALSDPAGINTQLRPRRRINEFDDWRAWGQRLEESRRASYMWRLVLSQLASKREIDQERLLELIFKSLTRLSSDTESKASSGLGGELSPVAWFHELHDEMNLSLEKKQFMAARYIGLLTLKDSSTLAWAVQNLLTLQLDELPIEDLLANISRTFFHKRKEAAMLALKLLEQVLKQGLSTEDRVASVALEALEHQSADVQKRALNFLKKNSLLFNPTVSESLKYKSERLPALLKKEMHDLLKEMPGDTQTKEARVEEELDPYNHYNTSELIARVQSVQEPASGLAGLKEALNCLQNNEVWTKTPNLNSMQIPRLDPANKIQPVENLDDLIFLFLHILEGQTSAQEAERLLDGLMRLSHIRPADFEERTSSLKKKLEPMVNLMQRQDITFRPFAGITYLSDLQCLGVSWLDGKKESDGLFKGMLKAFGLSAESNLTLPPILESAMGVLTNTVAPLSFFAERLISISKHLPRRISLPLLASPTHKGFFIDPLVLPGRLSAWDKAGLKPDKADLIQCLLRLAPENRKEALAKIKQDNDEYMRAIRYALGDELKSPLNTPELWVAAYRCREPFGNNEFLQERFAELGPDSALSAKYIEKMEDYKERGSSIYGTVFRPEADYLPFASEPAVKYRSNLKFFPTELLHARNDFFEGNDLMEGYFPLYRESYFMHLARRLALYLESQGNYWKSSWECLFDPDCDLSGMASWLLVLGLSAKQQETARLAQDALIQGIEDCRLSGEEFGQKMARALVSERITISRWLASFKDTARISPLHRHFVYSALESCLANIPASVKTPLGLLELLYETCMNSGLAIESQALRKNLESVSGKGKAFKISKLLLEQTAGKDAKHRQEVAVQILKARLERAERWQNMLGIAANNKRACDASC